jgi:hypothetical protein
MATKTRTRLIHNYKNHDGHVVVRTNARVEGGGYYVGDPATACSCGWFNIYASNQQAGCGMTGHLNAAAQKRRKAAAAS